MNTQQKEPLEGIGKPEPQQPRRQPQTTLSRKEKTDVAKILGFAGALVVLALVGMLIFLRPSTSEVEGRELTKFPQFTWDSFWDGSYFPQSRPGMPIPFRDGTG